MRQEDWIRVVDRLPEAKYDCTISERVFVCWSEERVFRKRVQRVDIARYHWDEEEWYSQDDWRIDVTHWMPIVLPKEDCV